MARLTYCTYLLHPVVITLYTQTKQVPIHWTVIEFVSTMLLGSVQCLRVFDSLEKAKAQQSYWLFMKSPPG